MVRIVNELAKAEKFSTPPLKSVRKISGLSQKKMAAAIGCQPGYISLIESRQRKGRHIQRLGWLVYLMYLRSDPINGWIKSALGLAPDSSICTINREELKAILRKLKAPMSEREIAKIYDNDEH